MKKHVVLLLVAVCILAVSASAEESSVGGFFDFIIDFFSGLLVDVVYRISSVFGGGGQVVCDPPYMRYGSGCCLDADGSGLCDRDEATTTTTWLVSTMVESTTTSTSSTTRRTTTTSTTTSTSTTTTLFIRCNSSIDCGEQTEVRICYNGDVYLQRKSPRCEKPGTPESYCSSYDSLVGASMMSKPVPVEKCGYGCEGGECLQ